MRCPTQISSVILAQLGQGEKGLLRLVVAVRRGLGGFEKGDLTAMVKSALHDLIASAAVVDADGIYSLSASQRRLQQPH